MAGRPGSESFPSLAVFWPLHLPITSELTTAGRVSGGPESKVSPRDPPNQEMKAACLGVFRLLIFSRRSSGLAAAKSHSLQEIRYNFFEFGVFQWCPVRKSAALCATLPRQRLGLMVLAVMDDLQYRYVPPAAATALGSLSPAIAQWFESRFTVPTPVQRLAWPVIAAGSHVLLEAQTGSGKTLAAFLPLLDSLLGDPPESGVRGLYVTPLKALGNDVKKNLRRTLRELGRFLPANHPKIRVGLRSGDTPARLRRRYLAQPPDIWLTTPESLAVVLTQPGARSLFANLRWVVVDEIHALAPTKRGADLSLSLERLARLARGPVQRIGLSASCAPPAEAARFLVGTNRPCTVVVAREPTTWELTLEPLDAPGPGLGPLLDALVAEISRHRTTLIFANIRSLAERLVWGLRKRCSEWADAIAVHHSALAAARRRSVERRLKHGRLRAVVCSTSLELGIDIGSVDSVVLVRPPGGAVRLLQRIGRANHAPGQSRHGTVLTTQPAELLEAAVTASAAAQAQLEPLQIAEQPLDVLCQQLLGMAAAEPWTREDAWSLVRQAYPYRALSRPDFEACLQYLSGQRSTGEAWLPARLCWFGDEFSALDERTVRILQRNLGSILAEECRPVRQQDGTPVGELETAFAERLHPGDRFLLDGRCLEVRTANGDGLDVEEVFGRPVVPRWGSEGGSLPADLARRVFLLRQRAAEALRDGPICFIRLLGDEYGISERAAATLVPYFERQEMVSEIPELGSLLLECVPAEDRLAYYLHTPLYRAANDAVARLVTARLARDLGRDSLSVIADLGCAWILRGTRPLSSADWRRLLCPQGFDQDLEEALAESISLRERFHRVALTGLMLLRNPLGRQRRVGGRDWPERRLFDQVRSVDPDFVLLRQARRELVTEVCDAALARDYLEGMASRPLRCRRLAQVSPFAESWLQPSAGPAEISETPAEVLERLHATLTQPAVAG